MLWCTGQKFTYKVSSYGDVGSFKERPPNVFATNGAYKNISGPGSAIADAQPLLILPGLHVMPWRVRVVSSAKGDVLCGRAERQHRSGSLCSADTYKTYSPCVTPLWSHGGMDD